MPRVAKAVTCDEHTLRELQRISRSQSEELRLIRRAKIVLGCIEGKRVIDLAEELNEKRPIIIKWRDRFIEQGIVGLHDAPRSGKPVTYGDGWKKAVLDKLDEVPPEGQSVWDGPSLAAALQTSEDAVQRFLQKEGIQLARMRTWCVSTDPEFAAKAADIVGLYLNPPENAVVICVDEKPSIQALSRRTGYVHSSSGVVTRAIQSTYRRNGTQNLFAALEVATGLIYAKTTKTKKRVDFLQFMDELLEGFVIDEETEFHVILDNYCIHKRCYEWLDAHPGVYFHFPPTSASWLNMVEIWFGIMSRKVLKGASFNHVNELSEAITAFTDAYNENAHPFVWRKREVHGSQIRNTISNLRG